MGEPANFECDLIVVAVKKNVTPNGGTMHFILHV